MTDLNRILRCIAGKANAVNFAIDRNGFFTFSDGKGLAALGLKPGEIVGQSIFDLYADHPGFLEIVNRALNGESVKEIQEQVIDGETVSIEHELTPLLNGSGTPEAVVGVSTIPGSRFSVDRRLEQKGEDCRNIVEKSPIGILVYELTEKNQLILKSGNPASDRILGISLDERLGMTIEEAFPSLMETEIPDRYKEVAANGVFWSTERIDFKDDRIPGAFEVYAFQTRPGVMAVFFQDITERVRNQQESQHLKKALEDAVNERTRELDFARLNLIEAEKMSSLGRLVAGVAHEINTPVGVCKTGISYMEELLRDLRQKYENNDLTTELFQEMLDDLQQCVISSHKSIDRAAKLISSFKNVAVDQSREQFRLINVSGYIEEVLESLHNKVKKESCEITVDCDANLTIFSAPGALFRIVTNLVMNTIHHGLPESSQGRIRMHVHQEKDTLHFRYRDNGPGLNEESRRLIFEPFYTTRRSSGGTGLGMHLVYNAVTQTLRGDIRCPENPEGGFLCEISFPLEKEGSDLSN